MKKYNIIFYVLLVTLFCGCQQDENIADGYGYLQLSSVELDKSIVQTKADGTVIALDIYNGEILVKHADDWTTVQAESLLLPVGTYTVKAYTATGTDKEQGFDVIPYYSGSTEVVVEKNVAKTVDVKCTLAQAKVSVAYSDRFKAVFGTYSCAVSNAKGTVDFVQAETRQAFVCAGEKLNATVTMSKIGGMTKQYTHEVAASAAPKTLYKLTYDVNTIDGSADFEVVVNIQVDRYDINVTVPLTSDVDPALTATSANAWGQFAYLYGTSTATYTEAYTFQYKKASDTEWTSVPATLNNGVYEAKTGLLPFNTAYSYRLVCGTKVSATKSFTTEAYQEIPNLNFDTWSQSGKNWFANDDASDSYWASGNTGVTMALAGGAKLAITEPVDGLDAHTGKAVKMHTVTDVNLVGAAAGNIFIGSYNTNWSNPSASVTFGRSYTGARPVVLSGWYKYTSTAITKGTYPGTLTMDECNIYIKLWDASGNEIAFGELVDNRTTTNYEEFEIPITYKDMTAKPAKITIVATSSHYGGEFSGSKVVGQVGTGSTLWVDDFSLSYYKE